MVSTPKICSCHACGNPRKFFLEKTLHEKEIMITYKEFMDDIKSFKGATDEE